MGTCLPPPVRPMKSSQNRRSAYQSRVELAVFAAWQCPLSTLSRPYSSNHGPHWASKQQRHRQGTLYACLSCAKAHAQRASASKCRSGPIRRHLLRLTQAIARRVGLGAQIEQLSRQCPRAPVIAGRTSRRHGAGNRAIAIGLLLHHGVILDQRIGRLVRHQQSSPIARVPAAADRA